MTNVLELMLYSYAFMVSGLFIPILVALYGKRPNSLAAILSMIIGGTTTVALIISNLDLPFGLDANIFGISASAFIYFLVTLISKKVNK
jgi:SSS family solute:Na+ symporter